MIHNIFFWFSGKAYKMFTAALSDKLNDTYVDFDFAFKHCENLRARLPVLDSLETISVVKKYLEEFNFTTLEVITYLKTFFRYKVSYSIRPTV